MNDRFNILVLGSGGREHALALACAKSPHCDKLFIAPGNGGTAQVGTNVALDILDGAAVTAFAQENAIELVVVGPEAPLVAGVGDTVRAAGIAVFGPGAEGARIEGSKTFSKELMIKYGLPTAKYGAFDNCADALAYLDEVGAPIVVKADGLAAGKGVIVAEDIYEAREAVEACFGGQFGAAGASVVIEEKLEGPECSILAFTDGISVYPMAPAQDHKRVGEGDTGLNTGGMGAYSPVPTVSAEQLASMHKTMNDAVAALAAEGIDYRGVLYGGFMLTAEAPKLLEFNARFGDPETQVVLPRLKTDLVEVMCAVAEKRLAEVELEWAEEWAVTVVLASGGYPGSYEKGKLIIGADAADACEGVTVYHAGTKMLEDGSLVTSGGRVIAVTALGADFKEARDKAYAASDMIDFEGVYKRRDIGWRQLIANV